MRAVTLVAAVVAAMTTAACRAAVPASAHAELKPLKLTPTKPGKPVVGAEIDVTAEGLPPNRTVDLIWETVAGGWVVEDGYRFKGKRFTESTRTLARPQVAADGRLQTRFTVPEDFGGVHSVTAKDGGTALAQGGIEVTQTFD